MTDDNRAYTPNRYAELAAFESEWRDTWWNVDFLELMARRWQLDRARRVLDVGAGAGHWGQMLARVLPEATELVGVEAEPEFVERATRRAEARGLASRFRYVQGRAEALPIPDGSIDVVTCQTLLIHVPDVRAVLREMLRVLVPGGLLALVEPNNIASALVELTAHPRPAWDDVEMMLRFQDVCERGKIAQGRGDSSVGEHLPGILAELGVEGIQVFSNDRCATLYPPYDRPEQRVDLAQLREWMEADVWTGAGSRDETLAVYTAGGGDLETFEHTFPLLLRHQRAFLANVERGAFHGSRGFPCYLVSGRKP